MMMMMIIIIIIIILSQQDLPVHIYYLYIDLLTHAQTSDLSPIQIQRALIANDTIESIPLMVVRVLSSTIANHNSKKNSMTLLLHN